MKSFKKIVSIMVAGCLAFCMLAALTACGEKKTLTVATSPDYPPFENLVDGEIVGFEAELWQAIADEMGVEFEWKQMQFDAIEPAITAGEADLGISGFSITPDREKSYLFSDSYFTDDIAVAALSNNKNIKQENAKTPLNKAGVIIAVQSGTTGETFAKENFSNATVKGYGNSTDCFAAVQAGKADAVCTNLSVVSDMLSNSYTNEQTVYKEASDEQYGFLMAQDKTDLQEQINEALKTLEDNGKLDELKNKWFAE